MVTGIVIKTKASMLGCWLREAGPLAASLSHRTGFVYVDVMGNEPFHYETDGL